MKSMGLTLLLVPFLVMSGWAWGNQEPGQISSVEKKVRQAITAHNLSELKILLSQLKKSGATEQLVTGLLRDVIIDKEASKGLEIVKILVNSRLAKVNVPDKNGWTALHFAAITRNKDRNGIVAYLVERTGARSDARTEEGLTAYDLAVIFDHWDFKKRTNVVSAPESEGTSLLCQLCRENFLQLFPEGGAGLLAAGKENVKLGRGEKSVQSAIKEYKLERLEALLKQPKKNGIKKDFLNALLCEVISDQSSSTALEVIKLLVKIGLARVNEPGKNGMTALHFAAITRNFDRDAIIKYLVKKGRADIYAKTNAGLTAYDLGVIFDHWDFEKKTNVPRAPESVGTALLCPWYAKTIEQVIPKSLLHYF
ncbi:MAG: ankyrin repeat domain-containing protein [Candidatus Dependentiae bacterium]|nr:ankyrin repeat domain-containing protein [Candidatus Dependentiae bacterium]